MDILLYILYTSLYKFVLLHREHKPHSLSRLGLCSNDEDDMNIQGESISNIFQFTCDCHL